MQEISPQAKREDKVPVHSGIATQDVHLRHDAIRCIMLQVPFHTMQSMHTIYLLSDIMLQVPFHTMHTSDHVID